MALSAVSRERFRFTCFLKIVERKLQPKARKGNTAYTLQRRARNGRNGTEWMKIKTAGRYGVDNRGGSIGVMWG